MARSDYAVVLEQCADTRCRYRHDLPGGQRRRVLWMTTLYAPSQHFDGKFCDNYSDTVLVIPHFVLAG